MTFLEKAQLRRRELDAIAEARDEYAGRLRDVAEAVEAMHESPSFTQLLDFLDELRELMEVSL